jgi:hypothetical protein
MSRNTAGVPYKNPVRYVGPGANLVPVVKQQREPLTTDKLYNLMTIWLVGENPSTGTEGDLWYLAEYEAGDAIWRQFDIGAGGSGIDFLRDQIDTQSGPDGSGNVDIDGLVVANGVNPSTIPLESVAGTNKIVMQLQVGKALPGAPVNKNDAGICSFDDSSFSQDANGYVTLKGGVGPAVDTFDVDFSTAPGTDPVAATGAGLVTVVGNAVDNATNTDKPVATHSRAANALTVEVQVGAAVAATPADNYDAGILSMDSAEFSVDTNGFTNLVNPIPGPVGTTTNLSFTHAAGTMTLHAADGSALSATNPGYVILQSNATAGEVVVHKITANETLTVSDMNVNLFGTVTALAWGASLPLYVGFMADASDANLEPFISRLPNLQASPAAAGDIGDPSAANADKELSVFAWNDITEANYTSKQVAIIGSFTATKAVTTDAWTFDAFSAADGIGKFNDSTRFDFPEGQNGAATGSYIDANGGTAPTFTNQTFDYSVSKSGKVQVFINFQGNTATDGAGAVDCLVAVPLRVFTTTDAGRGLVLGSGSTQNPVMTQAPVDISSYPSSNRNIAFWRTTTTNYVLLSAFVDGARYLHGECEYTAYNGVN